MGEQYIRLDKDQPSAILARVTYQLVCLHYRRDPEYFQTPFRGVLELAVWYDDLSLEVVAGQLSSLAFGMSRGYGMRGWRDTIIARARIAADLRMKERRGRRVPPS